MTSMTGKELIQERKMSVSSATSSFQSTEIKKLTNLEYYEDILQIQDIWYRLISRASWAAATSVVMMERNERYKDTLEQLP